MHQSLFDLISSRGTGDKTMNIYNKGGKKQRGHPYFIKERITSHL